MNNLFAQRPSGKNGPRVPVWFMRQAGRYHTHYQERRKKYSFMELCKTPEVAAEVTMGPIEDFNFDAAIIFSDLLFPLEHLGLGLSYDAGPPQLSILLQEEKNFADFKPLCKAEEFYRFQNQAVSTLRRQLPSEKSLLGFVGSPFTLFTYACENGHKGHLISTKTGLYDGRFSKFCHGILDSVLESMRAQAQGGADTMCIFDTAAGELSLEDFQNYVVPALGELLHAFKKEYPEKHIIYYSKLTHRHYFKCLEKLPIDALGIDWRHDLRQVFAEYSERFYIQGNIDPLWLFLPWEKLRDKILTLRDHIFQHNYQDKWIFGLGHGVVIKTPQDNVKKAVELIRENF